MRRFSPYVKPKKYAGTPIPTKLGTEDLSLTEMEGSINSIAVEQDKARRYLQRLKSEEDKR